MHLSEFKAQPLLPLIVLSFNTCTSYCAIVLCRTSWSCNICAPTVLVAYLDSNEVDKDDCLKD